MLHMSIYSLAIIYTVELVYYGQDFPGLQFTYNNVCIIWDHSYRCVDYAGAHIFKNNMSCIHHTVSL